MLRTAGLTVLASVLVVASSLQASAEGAVGCASNEHSNGLSGSCTLRVTLDPSPGRSSPKADGRGHLAKATSGGQGQAVCRSLLLAREIECATGAGYWSNERQCYVRLASPQPPRSDAVWEGHADGAVYECQTRVEAGSHAYSFWSATQPAGVAAPPDPAVLAKRLAAQMNLRAIDVGMAPEDRPGVVGTVGLPVWMWVENPSAQTFGPQTRSLSERGVAVSATAKVKRVVWQMGDGQAVTCTTAGSVFGPGDGGKSSPDCGHTYSQRGTYTIRATSFWAVDWTASGGQTGSIAMDFTTDRVLEVGEVQVIGR